MKSYFSLRKKNRFSIFLSLIVWLSITLSGCAYAKQNLDSPDSENIELLSDLNDQEKEEFEALFREIGRAYNNKDIDKFKELLAQKDDSKIWRLTMRNNRLFLWSWCQPEFLEIAMEYGFKVGVPDVTEQGEWGQLSTLTDLLYIRVKPPENKPWEKAPGYNNQLSCLKFLLDQGADPNKLTVIYQRKHPAKLAFQFSAMSRPAQAGDIELLELLHSYGGDLDEPTGYPRNRPLIRAAFSKQYLVIKWLLDNGADIYSEGEGGYAFARAGMDDPIIATMLLDYAVDPVQYHYLYLAARIGDIDLLNNIIKAKPDINLNRMKNRKNNDTHLWIMGGPLILASKNGHVGMVKHLLSLGVDPCLHESVGYYKDNAYVTARKKNHAEVLTVLENHQLESSCTN